MLDTALSTVVASTLLFASALTPQPHAASNAVFTRVLPHNEYVSYEVQPKDTFESISLRYYGSREYWENLSQDNPNVTDPYALKEGQRLAIRAKKPEKVVKQDPVPTVSQHFVAITPAPVVAEPTVQPTQIPVAQPQADQSGISEEALNYLGNCEAGMNPTRNTGNGYYGAFQFSYGTWKSMNTGYERADLAPIEVQKAAVRQLLQRSSIYTQFPGCAAKMRNAGLI